jgi:transposase
VLADETRMRMLDGGNAKPKNGFVWTFQAPDEGGIADIAYVFANGRSGETPRALLADTSGVLLVDGYSGYNAIANVSSRTRAACFAHVRRYFFEALPTAPVAQEAIDFILALYRVEHDARERGISGSDEHLAMRQEKSKPIRDELEAWLARELGRHPPKSPLGAAIRYAQGQWDALGVFLSDARIPLDNNASERALRRVALGRKNFLFVGDVESGKHVAGLYSLIATCEARGVNPFEYLTDVLPRVQSHAHKRIDELLPAQWAAAQTQA